MNNVKQFSKFCEKNTCEILLENVYSLLRDRNPPSTFDLSDLIFKSFIYVTILFCLDSFSEYILVTRLELVLEELPWVTSYYFKSKGKDKCSQDNWDYQNCKFTRHWLEVKSWEHRGQISTQAIVTLDRKMITKPFWLHILSEKQVQSPPTYRYSCSDIVCM